MKKELLFEMPSPFRGTFHIWGYRFGSGTKSVAVVGAMRGDEIQQQYVCSQLVGRLAELEKAGALAPDREILIIPSANPFSMNLEKRFWAMDNTDINRMFPGYDRGETTQRIAAALFEPLKDFEYGIQMASFYIPGRFVPHVRMIRTGYEDTSTAALFGLPFVSLRDPLPFDTTLLNYNWQIWGTKAFSVYAGQNDMVEGKDNVDIVKTLIHFMRRVGALPMKGKFHPAFASMIIDEKDLVVTKSPASGIYYHLKTAGDEVKEGDMLGLVFDPYDGSVRAEVLAPTDGIVFFAHNKPLVYQNTVLYKIV